MFAASINLVDLAGSERIGKTGATGQALEEVGTQYYIYQLLGSHSDKSIPSG
jgi:hypothetical protein